jgi:hypothetical protein
MLEEDTGETERAPIIRKVVYNRGGSKMPTWLLNLANGVARANRCKHWYCAHRGLRYAGVKGTSYIEAAGTETNLERMELLIPWLIGEIERLLQEEKPSWLTRGEGRRWANSFRLGAASTIRSRLIEAQKKAQEEMKEECRSPQEKYQKAIEEGDTETIIEMDKQGIGTSKYSLVKVETALALLKDEAARTEAWVKENMKFGRGSHRSYYGSNSAAFSSGRAAGKRADIGGPRGRIKG